jgi:hypothetical protein
LLSNQLRWQVIRAGPPVIDSEVLIFVIHISIGGHALFLKIKDGKNAHFLDGVPNCGVQLGRSSARVSPGSTKVSLKNSVGEGFLQLSSYAGACTRPAGRTVPRPLKRLLMCR